MHRLIPVLSLGLLPLTALAETYGGVEFPDGAVSFADAVIDFSPSINGSGNPCCQYIDPLKALGEPELSTTDFSVSLGEGGTLTLAFTDNLLTGSGDDAEDLWVFEVGTLVESLFLEISADGLNWFALGQISGAVSGVDIDAFGFGPEDAFSFVKLRDDPTQTGTNGPQLGADIDAVGAISTTPADFLTPVAEEIHTAVEVRWASLAGQFYIVEASDSTGGPWSRVHGPVIGSGDTLQFFDSTLDRPRQFYRVMRTTD